MSRNGAGVYTAPASSFPAVANTLIESTKFNNIVNDISTALTGSLAANGETTVTANIPMASHKLTGLSAGSNNGDSVRYEQLVEAAAGSLEATPVTLASASTVAVGGADANNVIITGTTTITAFDTVNVGITRRLRFSGILTWTYNATSMLLPAAANITTAAGDEAEVVSLGAGNWKCIRYTRANGTAIGSGQVLQVVTATDAGASSSSNTFSNVTASAKLITPKSTNSTIIVECFSNGTATAGGAGTNTTGVASLYSNDLAATFGNASTIGVGSSGGTNMQTQAMFVNRGMYSNSTLTQKSFLLHAKYSSAACTVSAQDQVWTLTEIQS